MNKRVLLMLGLAVLSLVTASVGEQPRFKVLAFYSPHAEPDHVLFAESALKFFTECAAKDGFTFDATTDWANLNDEYLKPYQLVVWLNDSPGDAKQRRAFQRYMENGGAWLGFHAAGYNDQDTNWPWFVDLMGGAVFHINSWPPLPAKLIIDDAAHPTAAGIPHTYDSPNNEWYVWKPSPRLNKDVRILATLDPSNYPLGLKDVLQSGDLPVAWTNTKYKMIYMNMGHGDKIFTHPIQNRFIENAVNWLGTTPASESYPAASGKRISSHAIAVNPKTGKTYAVDPENDCVAVLDAAGHYAAAVKVGTGPGAIAIDSVTNRIYVANEGSGNVSVIDGATDKVMATVPVGDLPYVIAANPVTNKIYIAKTFSNTITVIDGANHVTSSLKAGMQADAIAVDPGANKLYLLNYESHDVTVLDGATDKDTAVAAEIHLWGIAVNPATHKIYLTGTGSSRVTVIDGKHNTTTSVNAGGVPCAVAVDSSTGRVFIANYATDDVTVIDGGSNAVIATVRVGSRPQAIAVDSASHRVYVANSRDNTATIIDGTTINGATNSVLAAVKTGSGPYAIAVNSATDKAFVENLAGGTVTVIDGKTLAATTAAMPTVK
jgi:YVTN family beta-propeller protein